MKHRLKLPNFSLSAFCNNLPENLQIHQPEPIQVSKILGLVGIGFFSAVGPAVAHHATGGDTPTNFFEGFVSGLAHPMIGLDHLAFIVAIGLIATSQRQGALLPGAFVVAAMAGTGVHLLSINLPAPEAVIAVSVITLGVLLATGKHLSFPVLMVLATLAGVFHGYAYGEAIVGAEMTPLLAYLAGFSLIQLAIALTALVIGNTVIRRTTRHSAALLRLCGYGVCAIGIAFFSVSVVG